MLMTCANPDCSVPFHADSRQVRSVQHFWLCTTCSGLYTLEYGKDDRVVIRQRLLAGRSSDFLRVIRADGL